ncbi:MAG: DUF192 domain-containing protein [Deltaproteobacteria bacterium]|jgi:uncharacterized membrane protein (UPF0127 family)
MKNSVACLLVAFVSTLWVIAASSAEPETLLRYLPRPSELGGWQMEGVPGKAEGEELFQLIKEKADIYLRAGFKRAILASYQNGAGKRLDLKLFEMVSPESARAVYKQKTGGRGERVSFGNEALLEGHDLSFWKANFQVTVNGYDSGKETVEGLLKIGEVVDKKIGGWDYAVRVDAILDFLDNEDRMITSIAVEIADRAETHARGLMGRYLTDNNQGMLFVFPRPEPRWFWMRNTPTSLDIIFVGEDRKVMNVAKETVPMCDTGYRSSGPARYVVEVKAGFADRYGIRKGTGIRWRYLKYDPVGFQEGAAACGTGKLVRG